MGALLALLLTICPNAPGTQGQACLRNTMTRIRATSGLPMRATGMNMLPALPIETAVATGDKAGNWWVLKGDGTMLAGSSTTLSPVGAPTTPSWIVIPSGPNGTLETQTLLNPTNSKVVQWFISPVVAAPTGSFTTCGIGMVDGVNKAATPGPDQPVVMFATDAFGNASWALEYAQAGALAGLTAYATGIVNVPNLIPAVPREQTFTCGVFQSSTLVKSCTFWQGTAGAQCVQAAHATAAISAVAKSWIVGARDTTGAADEGWRGLFRGAFYTEKALTTADITRIGIALLPAVPTGTTFARASIKTCCVYPQCVVLSPNVPCVLANRVVPEPSAVNRDSNSERPAIWGGSSNPVDAAYFPVQTANAGFSPFGVKTADEVTFPATDSHGGPLGEGYASFLLPPGVSVSPVTTSFFVMGASGTSGTIDVCQYTATPPPPPYTNGRVCLQCSYGPTWNTCHTTMASTTEQDIGNLSLYSGIPKPAITDVYLFGAQEETTGFATSYINTEHLGAGTVRAVETCIGAGC